MITAFFERLAFDDSAACACNFQMPGRLNVLNPASPVCKNARRPPANGMGPGQNEVDWEWLMIGSYRGARFQRVRH
jgi:hypothetical protein